MLLAPQVLAVHIKRNVTPGVKDVRFVHFPLDGLSLDKVLYVPGGRFTYKLQSMAVHIGETPLHGHWVAYVRRGDKWFMLSDRDVQEVTAAQVKKSQASVLFYEKVLNDPATHPLNGTQPLAEEEAPQSAEERLQLEEAVRRSMEEVETGAEAVRERSVEEPVYSPQRRCGVCSSISTPRPGTEACLQCDAQLPPPAFSAAAELPSSTVEAAEVPGRSANLEDFHLAAAVRQSSEEEATRKKAREAEAAAVQESSVEEAGRQAAGQAASKAQAAAVRESLVEAEAAAVREAKEPRLTAADEKLLEGMEDSAAVGVSEGKGGLGEARQAEPQHPTCADRVERFLGYGSSGAEAEAAESSVEEAACNPQRRCCGCGSNPPPPPWSSIIACNVATRFLLLLFTSTWASVEAVTPLAT
jgi:hypothetical protein